MHSKVNTKLMLIIPDIVYIWIILAWAVTIACIGKVVNSNKMGETRVPCYTKTFFCLCQISHLWKNVFLSVCQEVF